MMTAMKITLTTGFLMSALVYMAVADAQLYKGVDAEGKVVYSDKPFAAAEEYTPPPISVMDAANVGVNEKKKEEKKPAELKYISFDIVSPVNNQTIRNAPDVNVSLRIKPGLNTDEDHRIWMLVNGKPVIKNTQSLSFKVGRLDRGANELQAQIRNKSGKIVARTRTTVVFVHQTSAR